MWRIGARHCHVAAAVQIPPASSTTRADRYPQRLAPQAVWYGHAAMQMARHMISVNRK